MKKMITFVLAALTCLCFTACAPMDVDKAEEKMEKAGYKVTVVDGTLAEIIDENAEASLTAIKSGDMLTAVLFKDFKSANEYYKKAMDEDKEKGDQVVKKNGKWVFVGTEDAIEDFTKLF